MTRLIRGRIDPATGVFTSYDQPAKAAVESRLVDPEVAAHEARHAAIALMHGVRVTEARADYPAHDTAGWVRYAANTGPRDEALIRLAGEMGQPGWPPEWPSRSTPVGSDEHRLAELVDELELNQRGWEQLCAEAKNLVASPGIDQLKEMIEMFLAKGHVLNEDTLATFYNAVCPPRSGVMAKFDATAAGLQHKSFATATDADSAGEFQALVAVFNNIDKGGDRILPGAFTKTLAEWRASGDPVPVIWSHDWNMPDSHIGVAYAKDMQQTHRGLLVKGQLDIDDNPVAQRVHKLMQRRSLKEFSFGYSVPSGGARKAEDGANELIEIDLYEIGPTLKGMNPATELHSVKGIAQATDDTLKARFRAETYALLTDAGHEPGTLEAGTLEDRFDREQARRHQRELRRQCDRMRLEEALGWDADLIERLRT